MLIYSLVVLSALAFWLFGDKSRFRELFPSMLAGAFVRMKEQYLLTHVFHVWEYNHLTPIFQPLKLPVLLDLSLFPVASYLFAQHLPQRRLQKFTYVLIVSALMTFYEVTMLRFGHLVQHPKWNLVLSYLLFVAIFVIIILIVNFTRRKS